jgi:hypothetical protein
VITAIRTPVRRTVDAIIDGAIGAYRRVTGSTMEATPTRIAGAQTVAVAHAAPEAGSPGTAASGRAVGPAPAGPALPHRDQAAPGTVPTRPVVATAPADPSSVTVTRQLDMDHTGHTLTVRIVDGRPQVVLASLRQQYLQTLVAAALAEERRGQNRIHLVELLTQIEGKLRDLGEDWFATFSKADADKRLGISQMLSVIADILQGIGKEFHIHDLEHLGHASKYAEGNRLKPEHVGRVRDRFYPSGYVAAAERWRDEELERRRDPKDRSRFRDLSSRTWEPVEKASIDHKYRVVQHWNDIGHTQGQGPRADYYNDFSDNKLQVVALRNNSADGALARALGHLYQPIVGPDFRGPDDNP